MEESSGGVWSKSVENATTVATSVNMEAAWQPRECVRLWEGVGDMCDMLNQVLGLTVMVSFIVSEVSVISFTCGHAMFCNVLILLVRLMGRFCALERKPPDTS